MKSFEKKFDHAKNKVTGVVNQTAGKITGDEVLELKGRIQSSQADLQKKTDVDHTISQIKQSVAKGKAEVDHKVNEVQQSVAKKINDSLDKHEHKKSK